MAQTIKQIVRFPFCLLFQVACLLAFTGGYIWGGILNAWEDAGR